MKLSLKTKVKEKMQTQHNKRIQATAKSAAPDARRWASDMKKIFDVVTIAVLLVLSVPVAHQSAHAAEVGQQSVKPGYYIRFFSGSKSGGPERHGYVAEHLKKVTALNSYLILCVEGPDLTQANSFEVAEYEKKHPVLKVATKCEGSGEILVGPFANEKTMRKVSAENEIPMYDPHLYKDFMLCEKLCKELPH